MPEVLKQLGPEKPGTFTFSYEDFLYHSNATYVAYGQYAAKGTPLKPEYRKIVKVPAAMTTKST